jgi:molybdopterin synthase sulfur carrier subunit
MVRIVVPGVWASNGKTSFDTAAGPLLEILQGFVAEYPGYGRRLLGRDGKPASYINFCIDNELIPRHARAEAVVTDGSTVTIIPPMAGG